MAQISVDFRNNAGTKKCAVSPPRIISLEIGDETTGNAGESDFNGYFLNGQDSRSDVENKKIPIHGWEKNILIHAQVPLSSYDEHPSEKIKSSDNNDFNLCDVLKSVNFVEPVENVNSVKNTAKDKMKINPNGEEIDDLSDLLSTIVHDSLKKDEVNTGFNCYQRNNTPDCGIDLLDFDFAKNESAKDSVSSNNSSLKVEGRLSELLSSINIEESDGSNFKSFNTSNMCISKVTNEHEIQKEPFVENLSDLLAAIDLGNSIDTKIAESKKEPCLADLLQTVDIRKQASTLSNNNSLSFSDTNMFSKGFNSLSNSLNDSASDVSCSSNNSCASSFNERGDITFHNLFTKSKLTDRVSESDSSYGSSDSVQKGFSFFNYSSEDQFSLNAILTNKSDVDKSSVHEYKNINEEMSMADLLTIVSPDFKSSGLATSNKMKNPESSFNIKEASMMDLIESLNIKSKNFDCDEMSNKIVQNDEKFMSLDCVDGLTSKKVPNGTKPINCMADDSFKKDIQNSRNNIASDNNEITNGDDKTDFIDLRECIKSVVHKFTPTSPTKLIESENQGLKCVSPIAALFNYEEKSVELLQNNSTPFEFNEGNSKRKIKINSKQTLFSKALACKPKKDQSLLQKVANIKNELLGNTYPLVLIDCDVPPPVVESVVQSDRCILSNAGLVSFGLLGASCELQ